MDSGMTIPDREHRQARIQQIAQLLSKFKDSGRDFEVIDHHPNLATKTAPTVAPTDGSALKKPRLIVLDSSFNPPTLAHKNMVESAVTHVLETTSQSVQVLLLLAINNADKAEKPASFSQRLGMMKQFSLDIVYSIGLTLLARNGGPVDNYSASRLGIDIAVTTMPYFHQKCRAIIDSNLYSVSSRADDQPEIEFLAGFDTLIRIFNPKYYPGTEERGQTPMQQVLGPFFEQATLRITMRTDADWGSKEEQLAYLEELKASGLERVGGKTQWLDKIEMVEGRKEADAVVSSSAVRDMVKNGRLDDIFKQLTIRVALWIEGENLYAEGGPLEGVARWDLDLIEKAR